MAVATGVSGWNFGIPFGPKTPDSHAEFALRFTGRTAPTAAGLGTPVLFFTDDNGCCCTRTGDVQPRKQLEIEGDESRLENIISVCRNHTTRIQNHRIDLPSVPPQILPPNLWWANKPGFRFVEDERWVTQNLEDLPGIYEALCPPSHPDMRAAVGAFVERKFGSHGAYDPSRPGPWKESSRVKKTVLGKQDENQY